MADEKITQLTEDTSVALTDYVVTVEDPAGTPVTKKATVATLLGSVTNATANTTPALTDEMLLIDDPGGTPAAQKLTLTNLKTLLLNATAQYKLLGRNSSGAGILEELSSSANVFAILTAANYAAIRALLDLEGGTDFPSYSTGTTASSATPTPAGGSTRNVYTITALAAAAELQAASGSPVNGNMILLRIKDDGTARALTYNAIYRAMGVSLPTTTVLGKTLYMLFIYNSADSKWDLIDVKQEA